jgi:hypothetical protein
MRAANWIVYRRDKKTYGTLDDRNAWAFEQSIRRIYCLGER